MGYYLAYTLPTVVFFFSPLVLWLGRGRYRVSPPAGSVLGTAFRLWRYALHGRWSWNPVQCFKQLTADDFWESAKPSKVAGEKPAWMTFDDHWVDEVRRGFKACSVFAWFPIYCTRLSFLFLGNDRESCSLSCRAVLQPIEQQSDIAGRDDEHAWVAQRCFVKPGPVCAHHLHSHL